MKQHLNYFILVFFTACVQMTQAQCTLGSPSTEQITLPSSVGASITTNPIGFHEHLLLPNMVAGNVYSIETCNLTVEDTRLTLFNSNNNYITENDDACSQQSKIIFTPTVTGTYKCRLSDWNCVSGATSPIKVSMIAVSSPMTVTLNNTRKACPFGPGRLETIVTGGTGPYSYLFSNGALTPIIEASAGAYFVRVTDAMGQIVKVTDTIRAFPKLVADAGSDVSLCSGNTVVVLGGSPSFLGGNGLGNFGLIASKANLLCDTFMVDLTLRSPYQGTIIKTGNTYSSNTPYAMMLSGDFLPNGQRFTIKAQTATDSFGFINMTDGRFTAMGNVVAQNGRFFANKYNPADSLIYAISAAWANGNNHKLYTINPTTGTATFKTNLSGTIVNPFGLAFNSKGQAYIADAFTDRLYALNTSTGFCSTIGTTPMNLKSGGSAFDMDFDNQDNLYVIRYNSSTNTSTLCQISPSNGSVFVASNPVFWPSTTYTYVSLAIDGSLTNAYSWSPSVGLDDSLAANPKLTATTNMQYVLSVKDGCGTIAKDTVQVSLGSKSSAQTENTCGSSYTFNGQTYTQSGIYNDTLPSAAGCDSIITLNLTINLNPIPTVTASGYNLTTQSFAGYQWQLNGNNIAGATSQNYTAIANGSYAVAVTDANGCQGTSTAVNITGVGINSIHPNDLSFTIHPNPATSVLHIHCNAQGYIHTKVLSASGQLVSAFQFINTMNLNIEDYAQGVYIIQFIDENGNSVIQRFLKE